MSGNVRTTEADVELRTVFNMLTGQNFLFIPQSNIRNKTYLSPTALDKKSGSTHGHFPDFSVWIDAIPIMIVEVKSPDVECSVGYREGTLYAHHLNKQYGSGLNPCSLVLSTNGTSVLAGFWDADPALDVLVDDLHPGSRALDALRNFCSYAVLRTTADSLQRFIKPAVVVAPYALAGGPSILTARKVPNTFAAPLSPILRKFFTSKKQNQDPEIYRDAYVSSDETNAHDQVLHSLMKERLVELRGSLSETLRPTKHSEPKLSKAISDYGDERPHGQLQLITGSGIPSFHETATSLSIALDRCITSAKRCMRGRSLTSGMLGMSS